MHDDRIIETDGGSGLWPVHGGVAIAPFKFLQDGLFLGCTVCYAANRWLVRPHTHSAFFRNYFNDLLLIPCALPALLFVQRAIGLRVKANPPSGAEVLAYLVVWSFVCEWVAPQLFARAHGDAWDVLAYTLGAIPAWVWWNRGKIFPS